MNFLKINNNANMDLGDSEELFHSLGQYAQKQFGFKRLKMKTANWIWEVITERDMLKKIKIFAIWNVMLMKEATCVFEIGKIN